MIKAPAIVLRVGCGPASLEPRSGIDLNAGGLWVAVLGIAEKKVRICRTSCCNVVGGKRTAETKLTQSLETRLKGAGHPQCELELVLLEPAEGSWLCCPPGVKNVEQKVDLLLSV